MQTSYLVYGDPQHAWVKVPMKVLKELGIEGKITDYSYRKGDFAYLEEDQDASTFINALLERGITPKFRENYSDRQSRIRNFDCYHIGRED